LKNKILFWIDGELLEFGIAKFLDKKNKFELSAIYDIKSPLDMSFRNQKIINFKKEWFFWNYVVNQKKKPDMDYLKKFEIEYGIDLWNLAYTDRNFYQFNPFYTFKKNEILAIFEQECKFFELVLNETKPDFLIIRVTDFQRNHLLKEMCKKKGIKVLTLTPTRIGNRASITTEEDEFDENWDTEITKSELENFDEKIFLDTHSRLVQSKKVISGGNILSISKKIKIGIGWVFKKLPNNFYESYDHYGVTKFKAIQTFFLSIIKSKIRKYFIDKNFYKEVDDEKIILFPLQVEPERNVSLVAPYYSNQINLIANIAKSLPIGYKLYVKEHFNMKLRSWRKISDYKKIIELPNVKLLHPSVNSQEILKKSSLVITISSTVGLEAAYHNVPSITLVKMIYSMLPSVFFVKNFHDLPQTIKICLEQKIDYSDIKKFHKIIEKNSFECDVWGIYGLFAQKFQNSGFLINSEISMNELNLFFDEHEKYLEIISSEFIRAIKKSNNI
jgi:hypothetical protein